MKGAFEHDLPIKTKIMLYDHLILQLERELAYSKETKETLTTNCINRV